MTDQNIRKQLRILGYEEPSVEWDGALAAARAYAKQTGDDGQTVTLSLETAKRLFDLATNSPLMCSGSFETEDVIVLRELAGVIGVDPAAATPDEFIRDFPHPFHPFTISGEYNYVWDATALDGRRLETDAEVYARLGDNPDRCSAGRYNRRCKRPAADLIHQIEAKVSATSE
jgi:hypothetical protein